MPANGRTSQAVTTASAGRYAFSGIASSNYIVTETAPVGYTSITLSTASISVVIAEITLSRCSDQQPGAINSTAFNALNSNKCKTPYTMLEASGSIGFIATMSIDAAVIAPAGGTAYANFGDCPNKIQSLHRIPVRLVQFMFLYLAASSMMASIISVFNHANPMGAAAHNLQIPHYRIFYKTSINADNPQANRNGVDA